MSISELVTHPSVSIFHRASDQFESLASIEEKEKGKVEGCLTLARSAFSPGDFKSRSIAC